jgi:hypothetical protein
VRRLGLALLLVAASAGAEVDDFTQAPPEPLAGFVDWPFLSGELQTASLSFGYRFHVDPERPALYSVMRYRVRGAKGGLVPTEKFLWVERPGRAAPMRCFELRDAAGRQGAVWREMTPGTPEYVQELQTLMAVLAHQNREMQRQLQAVR